MRDLRMFAKFANASRPQHPMDRPVKRHPQNLFSADLYHTDRALPLVRGSAHTCTHSDHAAEFMMQRSDANGVPTEGCAHCHTHKSVHCCSPLTSSFFWVQCMVGTCQYIKNVADNSECNVKSHVALNFRQSNRH